MLLYCAFTRKRRERRRRRRDVNSGALDMNCSGWMKQEMAEAEPVCPSSRKMISRWVKRMAKKMKVGKWRKKVERECVEGTCGCRDSLTTTMIDSRLDESGNHRQETMLNFGVACCLLYVAAASKDELNKMRELHVEMDITLQKMRAVMQRKDSLEPSELKDGGSSCLTDIKEVLSCSSQQLGQSHSKPCPFSDPDTPTPCKSMKHNKFKQESCSLPSMQLHLKPCPLEKENLTTCESLKDDKSKQGSTKGIEELEAELAAELEHLQLQLDGELFSKSSQHHSTKMMVEDTALSTICASVKKVSDPGEVPVEVQYGVPPIELERKLHELLECRQQERIKELEAALECAENKLHEKEKEVLMWKDTALII